MSKKTFSHDFKNLPESIQALLIKAVERVKPTRIVLFGSRARGDNRENSDFDFAFFLADHEEQWSRFLLDIEEEPQTLYKVDLVKWDQLDSSYHASIRKEGVMVYGDPSDSKF